ncbi:hypothetical protein MA16_Dca022778 [Dendrobium catenatum]|uniref:Uncharacterized protein n=1 Tax=Dendrobium catenatum TaxID=906689 RepID=A0A2I0WL10_9ASPA|nr:hypothetical protein MA16_Dca022778 [Dendrobium catenatum]
MQHIHLGLIMVRVQTLHRRDAGTTALIVLRDTRWRSDVSIIGTMEIDLSSDTQLIYIAPNLMLSIHDFLNHIELVIMTHGYDEWQGGESNLLITGALVACLTNTSQTGLCYNITGVANYLASDGISAIPGRRHTINELQGRSWHLCPSSSTMALLVPHSLHTHQCLDGSLRLSFSSYSPSTDAPIWDLSDDAPENPDDDPFSDFLYLSSYLNEPLLTSPEGGGDEEPEATPLNPKPSPEHKKPKQIVPTQTCYALEDQLAELGYPQLRKMAAKAENLFASVSSNYLPPNEPVMGPVSYPPATSLSANPDASPSYPFQYYKPKTSNFRKSFQQNMWTLPSAHNNQGVLLILPDDFSLYDGVISRWESITLNLINEKQFIDNRAKVLFVKNLLGEVEKKTWIQWRVTF